MSNANFVQGALSVPVAIDGLIMTLGEAVAPYVLPPTDGGILVLADSVSRPSFVEIISYTSRSGQNLTGVLRAQEGTTARAWGVGTYVYQSLTAGKYTSDINSKATRSTTLAGYGIIDAEPVIAGSTASMYWNGIKGWVDFSGSVRSIVLTGLSLANAASVIATDSLLVAVGKLQKQITDQATTLSAKASLNGATFTGKVIGTLLSMAGYLDKTVTNATATGTVTLDLSTGSVFDLTLTGNTVLAFSNAPALSAETYCVLVRVRQGATAYTFTQPSGTTPITSGGTVPATPAANKIAEYIYSTANGTAWNLYAGPST